MDELDEIPEQQYTTDVSEPIENVSLPKEVEFNEAAKDIPSDSIVIIERAKISHRDNPQKVKLLNYVKPQDNKYWHFAFKDKSIKDKFTTALQTIPGYALTVEYDERINKADIILKQNSHIVGKIHFLLSDRRDANKPDEYYIKIFLFHFKSQQLFDAVKTTIINFFDNLTILVSRKKTSHSMKTKKNKTSKLNRPKSMSKSLNKKNKKVTHKSIRK